MFPVYKAEPANQLYTKGICTIDPLTIILSVLPSTKDKPPMPLLKCLLKEGLIANLDEQINRDMENEADRSTLIYILNNLVDDSELVSKLYSIPLYIYDNNNIVNLPHLSKISSTYCTPYIAPTSAEFTPDASFLEWFWKNAHKAAKQEVFSLIGELAGSICKKFKKEVWSDE